MIKKIVELVRENRRNQKLLINQSRDLKWAHIYHDSIRGKEFLETLSLNIGRWHADYSFFYVLHRILSEYKPKSILELGLGESTTFITTFLKYQLKETRHLVIEQDASWKEHYLKNHEISSLTSIEILPVVKDFVKEFEVNYYEELQSHIEEKFDLYIIDGPIGTRNYSRYDMYNIAKGLNEKDDFLFVIDDYHRKGERETVEDMKTFFKNKKIDFYETIYHGTKQVLLLGSKKYLHTRSF